MLNVLNGLLGISVGMESERVKHIRDNCGCCMKINYISITLYIESGE